MHCALVRIPSYLVALGTLAGKDNAETIFLLVSLLENKKRQVQTQTSAGVPPGPHSDSPLGSALV